MAKLTYQNKTNPNPVSDRSQQATAEDFNEIKLVVNENADFNIPSWSNKAWPSGYVVEYLGILYKSKFAIAANGNPPLNNTGNWDVIGDSCNGTLTAEEIRDLLQTLQHANRINKFAIQGCEFALNRRGKGDIYDVIGYQNSSAMGNILKGDYWIYDGGETDPSQVTEGDYVVALVDGIQTPFNYMDGTNWEVIPIGSIGKSTLTAAHIIALINSVTTISNMVNGNRVKYDDSNTVSQKITALIASISEVLAALDLKQDKILSKRITYSDIAHSTFTLQSFSKPIIQMSINRVPYQGVEADDFSGGASAFDFIWRFVDGNCQIMLHPSLSIRFEPNDLIDLIF